MRRAGALSGAARSAHAQSISSGFLWANVRVGAEEELEEGEGKKYQRESGGPVF